MKSPAKLRVVAFVTLIMALVYCYLIMTDHPISWVLPESFITWLPAYLLIPMISTIVNIRLFKDSFSIVLLIVSSVMFLFSLMFSIFLNGYNYSI